MKYYSEKTNKIYNEEKDLVSAEKEFDKKKAAEMAKKNERATRAKEVEKAFQDVKKAQDKANQLLAEFNKDYGPFHTSVQNMPNNSLFDFLFDILPW